jgi:hypothetical protein
VDAVAERLDLSDVGELTLGELELIETHTGVPMTRLQADNEGEGIYRVKFARSVALVVLRRRARAAGLPDPTWEDTDGILLPAGEDAVGEVAMTTPDPIPVGRARRRG